MAIPAMERDLRLRAPSLIATTVLRRPSLTGQDGAWVAERRAVPASSVIRALDSTVETEAVYRGIAG
ncbi:MAG: hypothetical protein ACYDAL_12285 [Candidatus Dormibacteraceae bacterium]